MIHTIAFSGSQSATSTSLQNIAGVSDPTLRVSGNFIYMPALSNLVGEYIMGKTITAAQLQAPSIKRLFNYDLSAFESGTIPASPAIYQPHYTSPFALQPNEGLQALVTQTGLTSTVNTIVVEIADGAVAPVSPTNVLTIKATFTAPATNYAWANATLTFSQTLPVGSYQCIGARVECSGGIYARFFPVGGVYRPGVHVAQSANDFDLDFERRGGKGVLFTFDQLTPPSIDIIGNSMSGTGTVYLDLVPNTTS